MSLSPDVAILWDLDTPGARLRSLSATVAPLTSVRFSPYGDLLTTFFRDRTLSVWRTGEFGEGNGDNCSRTLKAGVSFEAMLGNSTPSVGLNDEIAVARYNFL